jgi:hypothetical protein
MDWVSFLAKVAYDVVLPKLKWMNKYSLWMNKYNNFTCAKYILYIICQKKI